MPIVYAFDVDETLEVSRGPIKLQDLMNLRLQGHIVGLCGNWAALTMQVPGWQRLVSFLGEGAVNKEGALMNLKKYIPADDYVMVGNILGVSGSSDDKGAAERAGWRFIKESDYVAGAR
jgi:hypothetical protein